MIKQLGQLDLFHLVLSPAMCLPLHVPSKRPPQQNPSPMPSTNRKKCLRLSTCILFTSTSLRFPRSKSSMSSLHTSFLTMVQTSKSVSTLSNFCTTISSTSTFQGIQRPTSATLQCATMYILDALTWCIQWFKSHIQVKHALLKFIELFGCAVHWRTSNLQKYMSCLISRTQLSQRLAQVWSKLFG